MSLANILVPNDLQLFCGGLTSSTPIVQQNLYRIDFYVISPQPILTGTITTVLFPDNYIASGIGPASSGIYTAPIAGFYSISYSFTYNTYPGTGTFQGWILRADANVRYATTSSSGFEAISLTAGPPVSGITLGSDTIQLSGSTLIPLNAGETFQVQTYQNSGATLNLG